MKKLEALAMLAKAPVGDSPSRLNPALTKTQAVEIVRAAIAEMPDEEEVRGLMEKRVWQVCKNQRRPHFEW